MNVWIQLGVKKTFGFWALNVFVGGDTYSVPIPKKVWDALKDQGCGLEG